MVSVLAIHPRFVGSRVQTPLRKINVLRVIKIHGTISFGGEVQPLVLCNALRHVNKPYEHERDTS
jgi:hypothetical protein